MISIDVENGPLETEAERLEAFAGLVGVIAAWLITAGEDVRVRYNDGLKSLVFEVLLPSNELGKVIGKGGRIAQAIRTIAHAVAPQHFPGKQIIIDFIESDRSEVRRPSHG